MAIMGGWRTPNNGMQRAAPRTRLRGRPPWLVINFGIVDNGRGCEAADARHHGDNIDGEANTF
jgi:hypothetical protein